MSVDLRKELFKLRNHLLYMGAKVEQRVAEVIDSLLERDIEEARLVRHSDDEIDAMELDLEAECLRILALTHPVARDLRFVLAATRINTDLERIGDLAKSIAKRVIALDQHNTVADLPPQIREMAAASHQMLGDSLLALGESDVALSNQVRQADDRVDALLKEVFDWSESTIMNNVQLTASVIDILSIARKLERIADSATNIAEDVIFLADGQVVRHSSN
jgi:phosphate transport system protein